MDTPKNSVSRREAIRRGTALARRSPCQWPPARPPQPTKKVASGPGAPVVHFEIGCRNEAKTREFFGKLFGWEISAPAAANVPAMISAAKDGIGGHITSLGHEPQNYVTIYVQVDDIPSTLRGWNRSAEKKLSDRSTCPPAHSLGSMISTGTSSRSGSRNRREAARLKIKRTLRTASRRRSIPRRFK